MFSLNSWKFNCYTLHIGPLRHSINLVPVLYPRMSCLWAKSIEGIPHSLGLLLNPWLAWKPCVLTTLFLGKYFVQFGGPIEQFDIRTKLSLLFMVGLTTHLPTPRGWKGLAKLNHLYNITTCKCIAEVFIIFPKNFTFSLLFMKKQIKQKYHLHIWLCDERPISKLSFGFKLSSLG